MTTLTRTDTNEVLNLPDRLRWTDEYSWQGLGQSSPQYSLGGALIIQQGMKLAGRPITLSNDDNKNWLKKQDVMKLQEWANLPELALILNYQNREFRVIFANHQQALTADPVAWTHDETGEDWYRVSISFLTI